MIRFAAVVVSLLALLPPGQEPKPPAPTPPSAPDAPPAGENPKVDAKDVESVESIVAALYDVISGPAGQRRDWDRMRGLFHREARLVPMVKGRDGVRAVTLTVDDYVRRSGPHLERNGFFEQEIARRIDAFGDVAHVWSTYEARRAKADAEPFLRGINSIQLLREGGRWWILQVLWEAEHDAGPLPDQYLPPK